MDTNITIIHDDKKFQIPDKVNIFELQHNLKNRNLYSFKYLISTNVYEKKVISCHFRYFYNYFIRPIYEEP